MVPDHLRDLDSAQLPKNIGAGAAGDDDARIRRGQAG
jgi:hypothetical protein